LLQAKKRKQAEAGKAQGTQKTGGHSAQSQESEIIKVSLEVEPVLALSASGLRAWIARMGRKPNLNTAGRRHSHEISILRTRDTPANL
jgi:hypothetical protein